MTSIYKCFLLVFLTINVVVSTLDQQVFPVQVVGGMIPPRSLDLADYTVNRPQDLFFNAILNDPVEPFRQVKLKLTVKQNGQDIYVTDPNYAFTPIRLNQQELLTLDGSVLAPYLRPEALTGATGIGQGSVIIPEGANRICLQIIDLQRNVPISRKACVSGIFALNDPPQLLLPTCGEQCLILKPKIYCSIGLRCTLAPEIRQDQ